MSRERLSVWITVFVVAMLLLPAVSVAQGRTQGKKGIAYVGVVNEGGASAYDNRELLGPAVKSFMAGDKLVVLSFSAELVRVLLNDGSEVFISISSVGGGTSVTMADAMAKVRYFEKMSEAGQEWDRPYYEAQAAPWVALVARELANTPGGGTLPAPAEEERDTLSRPSLTVKNSTEYGVRIYMTGARTLSRTVPSGQSWTDEFPSGSYRVVAEAISGKVIPLRTTWHLKQGYGHTITLVIRTTIK